MSAGVLDDTLSADNARGWRGFAGRAGDYLRERRAKLTLRTLLTIFVVVLVWPFVTIVVPAGKVGVIFSPLFGGTRISRPLREGLNFIVPWNQVTLYDTRVQARKTEFEAVTSDGLHIKIGIIYRYRVHTTTAGRLHKAIGPDYPAVLLDPAINAVVRMEMAHYSADQIYGDRRSDIQASIYKGVVDPRNHNLIEGGSDPSSDDEILIAATPPDEIRGDRVTGYVPLVEIVDILITEVRLPNLVRQAIERKEEQQQLQEEYAFRIEREKLESQRKQIEAEGIRDFQQTVQAGISETYLRWRGIEATLRLATSPNSKTVIIGGGRTGMPLILNTEDGPAARTSPDAARRTPAKPAAKGGKGAPANDSIDLTRGLDQGSLDTSDIPTGHNSRK